MPIRRAIAILSLLLMSSALLAEKGQRPKVGQEVAIPVHMQDGEEYQTSLRELIAYGQKVFTASWTIQEGGGRPMSKGTGMMLSDLREPLLFPQNFNRISGP